MILRVGRCRPALIPPMKRNAHLNAVLRDVHARVNQEGQNYKHKDNPDHDRFVHRLTFREEAAHAAELVITFVDQFPA